MIEFTLNFHVFFPSTKELLLEFIEHHAVLLIIDRRSIVLLNRDSRVVLIVRTAVVVIVLCFITALTACDLQIAQTVAHCFQ